MASIDPATLEGARRVIPILAPLLRPLGRLVLINDGPDIVLGPWKTGEISAKDAREAQHRWLYVHCQNRQRRWLRMGWPRTRSAIGCRVVIELDKGHGFERFDEGVFAGDLPDAPTQTATLVPGDDRAWIPVFLRTERSIQHPVQAHLQLESGVYVTGARFVLRGQVNTERLERGDYRIRVRLLCDRSEWCEERTLDVPESEPIQPLTINVVHTVEFFRNRAELAAFGSLEHEISTAEHVWALWPAGTAIPTLRADVLRRVDRLVLCDPTEHITPYAEMVEAKSSRHMISDVVRATLTAWQHHVDVRWHPWPTIGIIIGDPTKAEGWARIEYLLPYTSPSSRPSCRLLKSREPDIFETLKNMFESVWTKAKVPHEGDPIFREWVST